MATGLTALVQLKPLQQAAPWKFYSSEEEVNPGSLLNFDLQEMRQQFDLDNKRFQQVNQEKLRARERAMLAEL